MKIKTLFVSVILCCSVIPAHAGVPVLGALSTSLNGLAQFDRIIDAGGGLPQLGGMEGNVIENSIDSFVGGAGVAAVVNGADVVGSALNMVVEPVLGVVFELPVVDILVGTVLADGLASNMSPVIGSIIESPLIGSHLIPAVSRVTPVLLDGLAPVTSIVFSGVLGVLPL